MLKIYKAQRFEYTLDFSLGKSLACQASAKKKGLLIKVCSVKNQIQLENKYGQKLDVVGHQIHLEIEFRQYAAYMNMIII